MKRFRSIEIILLAAIVILAAFFRFYQLDSIPPGFQFDQAFNAFDFLRLLQGQFAIFFPANTGREPLYFYLSMVSAALFGPTAFAVKLTSAVIGLLTIPLIYFFTRSFFSPSPFQRDVSPRSEAERGGRGEGHRVIALLAAFFTAISLWHIFFSRDGLRVILEVPLTLLTFWFMWRVISHSPNLSISDKRNASVKVGIFLALALYTYPSARLLPLALVFLTGYAAWHDRTQARAYAKNLGLAFLVAAILFAPLGIYFAIHPDQFFAHTESISVFDPRVSEGSIPGAIWKNLLGILGMFFLRGDGGTIHNLPFRPVFDPFIAVLFIIGVVVLFAALVLPRASRLNRDRAVFLLTWIAISLASSLFSDDAPNFLRMLPALPPIMILPAWGAYKMWIRLTGSLTRRLGAAAFGLLMLISTGWVYRDYFVTFANLPELYYTFDVDKVEIANWVNANEKAKKIFLAPLWYQQGTISLLTRNARLKTFDSRDTIVLPSRAANQDALYGFPPEQEQRVITMASRLGTLGAKENFVSAQNAPPMHVYRVPAQNLPDPQNPLAILSRGAAFVQPKNIERTVWSDEIALLGFTLSPEGPGGRNLTATLFLHALKQMNADYTFSIKVLDEKNRVWGQEDKWAGDNSYETSHWDAGDLVVEKFYPGLSACAPAGNYRVTVEAYNPKTSEVLALTNRNGNSIGLGGFRAGASEGNLYEHLDPDQVKELRIANGLQMLGYTLSENSVRVGENFSLSLFWRGVGAGGAEKVSVKLGDATLTDASIQIPAEGRGICAFYDFTVPLAQAPGKIPIRVNGVELASIEVAK